MLNRLLLWKMRSISRVTFYRGLKVNRSVAPVGPATSKQRHLHCFVLVRASLDDFVNTKRSVSCVS